MAFPPGLRLPAAVQTALFIARPLELLEWCKRRYGDVFTIDTLMFGREVEVVSPELIKQVFTGDPDVLRAGEANEILGPLLGPRSVLLLDGAEHLRQRRLLMPPFHGDHVLSFARTMRAMTEQAVASFPEGKAFSIRPFMQHLTLEVILRTVFGLDEGAEMSELRVALTNILDRQSRFIDAVGQAPIFRRRFFGLTPWDHFLADVEVADVLIYRQIARRRASARDGEKRTDVLAMLLEARDEEGRAMTDAELRDELMTLLVAGHETTATMLCWAFDLILGDARVLRKLRAEIETARTAAGDLDLGALARLPYLDAAIKEVLRIRPVIPAVGRRLKAPMKLGGYDIPAGEMIVPAIVLTHLLPDIYPDPKTFMPERFVDKKTDPYTFFPFGGGTRRCLGMAFALYEMKVVIASVLDLLDLRKESPRSETIKLRGFTLVPAEGTRVVIERRIAPSPRTPAPEAERVAQA
ncbi:MAG: cytochrome P450 [Byssovorax sp.]